MWNVFTNLWYKDWLVLIDDTLCIIYWQNYDEWQAAKFDESEIPIDVIDIDFRILWDINETLKLSHRNRAWRAIL